MITLLTGAPGSGKTAALVDLLLSLSKERALYVHGLNGLTIPHFELVDPTRWMDEVPDGAAVVIDEVQSVWRPRGPGRAVPPDVAALETHRHRGLDFFLTTQGPNLLDANVRALVGRHIHLREMGFLGRYWYEWPECADNCRTGWRGAPIKKRYKLPKNAFQHYTSASIHIKPIRSFPWVVVVAGVSIVATGVLAYRFYSRLSANLSPGVQSSSLGSAGSPAAASSPVGGREAALSQVLASIPRVPGMPHTAPRYDKLTEPVSAPYPAVCVSSASDCRCYTDRATRLDVPLASCRDIVSHGGFYADWLPTPAPVRLVPPVASSGASSRPLGAPPVVSDSQAVRDGEVIAMMRARSLQSAR